MSFIEYPMQAVAPTVAALLDVPAPAAAEAPSIAPAVNELAGVEHVAVLGVDALGVAIWRHWRERMPFFSALAERRLALLRSVLPSKTPVNFGCMVTGAGPEGHGVRKREDDFACETLFDVLRKRGRRSAGLGRKGKTGNELLGRYADVSAAGLAEDEEQLERIFVSVLARHRPHFLIAQYLHTDDVFHAHGLFSDEAGDAVAAGDAWLSRRVPGLLASGYGVLVLADHGQHEVIEEDGSVHGKHGSDSDDDCLTPLTWIR